MSGRNPYMKAGAAPLPTRPYRIRLGEELVEVDPTELPFRDPGQPGSLLASLLHAGIELDHACGGVCACSTCHVYVRRGGESCNEPSEDEEDMLDTAPALKPESRLACQCVPDGGMDIEVVVPAWNRNLVKEGHS
jgi:2Fe-2S ferredoxin